MPETTNQNREAMGERKERKENYIQYQPPLDLQKDMESVGCQTRIGE